ncbi:response regulator [Azospirillum picis]|uniref:CheY-like chemotaxis protein n=1 Tax=Azospirillum picis TaxID=488438 RepID=A0ABU0MMM6_9PROT|nr:response regulator [Azospirillum picis]MBP2300525.1 CheY-like chemotaxis protein [Azospirillum picis]MDQ0534494.1 CheY-like chemotaxis protein [Azospirillum picis]
MADRLDILIAEDDPCIAEMLSEILGDLGHHVVGVVDTAEGVVGFAGRQLFDLAVVDVWLADGSNGLDAVRHLTGRLGIPAIVCSGHAAAQDAFAAGAAAFLEKPFRIADLEHALDMTAAGVPGGGSGGVPSAGIPSAAAPPRAPAALTWSPAGR